MEENSKKAKKKGTFKKFGKYLREVSVVVIGVAITFIVSDWISQRNENKDIERYLKSIKLELQENLESMQLDVEAYELASAFSRYLNSDKRENLVVDSLNQYIDVIGYLYTASYNTSAFDMLKSSGAMRLIKDEVLLTSIGKCYNLMEEAKIARDKYLDRKQDELFNAILSTSQSDFSFIDIILNPKYERLLNFYSISMDVESIFKNCIKQIEKTLKLF